MNKKFIILGKNGLELVSEEVYEISEIKVGTYENKLFRSHVLPTGIALAFDLQTLMKIFSLAA